MPLFCVECGGVQPEDDPPLKPGVPCVKCKQLTEYTTKGLTMAWDASRGFSISDRRFLRSLKIAAEEKTKS